MCESIAEDYRCFAMPTKLLARGLQLECIACRRLENSIKRSVQIKRAIALYEVVFFRPCPSSPPLKSVKLLCLCLNDLATR